ncbi:hypothetical protein RIR_jg32485.t1 [Rhizophagus irregularis DAOM 181602=DAOM 197198]|nr:hypothetical protein RIR_jg32485.t1 [Rhizophagus irregularis DAOM 181602=DAOM 197198]
MHNLIKHGSIFIMHKQRVTYNQKNQYGRPVSTTKKVTCVRQEKQPSQPLAAPVSDVPKRLKPLDDDYNPTITFITLIDTVITHPFEFDFFCKVTLGYWSAHYCSI